MINNNGRDCKHIMPRATFNILTHLAITHLTCFLTYRLGCLHTRWIRIWHLHFSDQVADPRCVPCYLYVVVFRMLVGPPFAGICCLCPGCVLGCMSLAACVLFKPSVWDTIGFAT